LDPRLGGDKAWMPACKGMTGKTPQRVILTELKNRWLFVPDKFQLLFFQDAW
jgi:hypothetical protein